MKKQSRAIYILILTCGTLLCITLLVGVEIYALVQRYNADIAERYDYTKITTPLPRKIVDDICSKFELESSDVRCLSDSIVYGPDFFDDIKAYFKKLPDKEATVETVQNKLGVYTVMCENPNNQGHYACRYDLRGDGKYPILIFYTKEGHIYRIIANTGGS